MKKSNLVKSFFAVLFLVLLLVSCRVDSFKLTLPEGVEVVSSEKLDLEVIPDGKEVTLKVTIPENKKLGSFTVNEEAQSLDADNRYTFKMSADTTVAVSFVDITYSLTLPEDNSVSVFSPSGLDLGSVLTGTPITLEVTIPATKVLGSFTVNTVEQSLDDSNQYTFTISQDTTIAVIFVDTFSLTLPADGVSVTSPENLNLSSIPDGTEVTYRVFIDDEEFEGINELKVDNAPQDFVYEYEAESNQVQSIFVEKTITMDDNHTIAVSYDNEKCIPNFTSYSIINDVVTLIDVQYKIKRYLIIPHFVSKIGANAVVNGGDFMYIVIPDGVTSIGDRALSNLNGENGIAYIFIPDSVTQMGENVFDGSSGLTQIHCGAESQPAGWSANWKAGCNASVSWNQTRQSW